MTRVDFVDQLPLTVHCDHCGTEVRAPGWQVAAYGSGQWIGINIAECQACGSMHIGAAGSSPGALAESHKLRQILLENMNIDINDLYRFATRQ